MSLSHTLNSGFARILERRDLFIKRRDLFIERRALFIKRSDLFIKRRALIAGFAAALAFMPLAASAEGGAKLTAGPDGDVAELMKASDLADFSVGSADAKVTIVEYASLTCPHCAKFHKEVYPGLKSKYIDTGKVRFIFRDFPLNPRAFGGSMLARCVGGDKGLALLETLFDKQADWAFVEANPQQALFDVSKQAGFTQESFEKCLTDQKLFEQLTAMQRRGAEVHKVASTPTFFVNGKRIVGPTLEDFDKLIEPMLGMAPAVPAASTAAPAAPTATPATAPASPAATPEAKK